MKKNAQLHRSFLNRIKIDLITHFIYIYIYIYIYMCVCEIVVFMPMFKYLLMLWFN